MHQLFLLETLPLDSKELPGAKSRSNPCFQKRFSVFSYAPHIIFLENTNNRLLNTLSCALSAVNPKQ